MRTGVVLSRAVGAEGRCACADDCGPTLDETREETPPIAVVFWKEENESVRKPDPIREVLGFLDCFFWVFCEAGNW